MSRRRLIAVFLPVLAILLVAGLFYALLHTGPGARWLWQRVAGQVPGQLEAGTVSGDLQSGLRLERLSYRDDGLAVTADSVTLRLDVDLLPPALAVHRLEFGALDISTGPDSGGEPVSLQDALTAMALPIPVRFGAVRGGRVAWRTAGEEEALELRDLAFSASWFRQLALRGAEVTVAAPAAMRWRGDVSLGLQAPFAISLGAEGKLAADPELGLEQALDLSVATEGVLGALRLQARAAEPAIALQGTLEGLPDAPAWDLQLAADRLPLPLGAMDPPLVAEGFTASSYGWVEDFGLEVEARFSGPSLQGLEGLRATAVAAGDAKGLQIERLVASADALAITGTGRLDWGEALAATGAFDIERIDPAPWFEPWGAAEPARGRLELAWRDGRLEFAAESVEAPGTVAALTGSGTYDAGSGSVDALLDWRQLAWPPGAAAPDLVSRSGTASVAGRLDGWRLEAALDLEAAGFTEGRLRLQGTGDTEGMALEIPRGELLGGSLDGRFEMRWSPDAAWRATARFADLSTTPLTPAWPARLSGEAALQGRLEPLELEADIRDLSGLLRDRPVTARGQLLYRGSRLAARGLDLQWGSAALWLDGDLGAADGLGFRVDIDSLGGLDVGAAGSLAGEGRVSLAPSSPVVVVNLRAEDLAWAGYSAESLRVTTTAGDAELRIEATGIAAGEGRIETLALATDSRRPFDRIEARAAGEGLQVALGLSGAVIDWTRPLAAGWRGSLQSLRLDGEAVGWVGLEEPAELSVRGEGATLAPTCFRGSREGRLCLEGRWEPAAGGSLAGSLEEVSPNLALSLAGSDLQFTQLLSGTFAWRQMGAAEPEAEIALVISPGVVRYEGEDESILETGRGRFGFRMADGRLFAGNLDIPMPGYGAIDTDFSAPDLSGGLTSPLQGRLQVNLRDIGPILELLPAIEGSSGPVAADLRFSGTIADPRLTGHASLVRGRISHFASGLLLENLQLAGAVYEFDQTELSGTFRAGEGQGSIRAVVNFDEILEPSVLVELQGENLTLVNVPDLNIRADPDLRLIWREGALDVAGRVAVPYARLSPRYLPTTSASESPDVVIVAGVDPYARPEQSEAAGPSVYGNLELELGEDVRLQLERAQARLSGMAGFQWNGPLVPIGSGGFDLVGDIYAYGQSLQVTDGRIRFANRPADNPFLTIRAEREIFGNSQVRRAGVLVTGTLKQPLLETYTDPMTTRERALALLVTGNDFDYEQGVGAVEVGMYVAPRLFISYGVGLFDDQNVISARYDLGRGFGVKATSGQRETGVDISYTIER